MKRRLSRLIALLFVVGISALALFMILRREESNRAPIEDMAIVYIDGAQIVKKALLNQYITESNRRLLATMAASQLDDEKLAESLTAAITNLDNTGLALNRPIRLPKWRLGAKLRVCNDCGGARRREGGQHG